MMLFGAVTMVVGTMLLESADDLAILLVGRDCYRS